MARIANIRRETLTDFVLDHVGRGSEVRTDAYQGYDDVGRHRFSHVAILDRNCLAWGAGGLGVSRIMWFCRESGIPRLS